MSNAMVVTYTTNNRWHKIYDVPNPYFIYKGKRYHLSDFIPTHNNPWVEDVYPEYIHGYYVHEYWNPMFIHENGNAVKVYTLKKEEN